MKLFKQVRRYGSRLVAKVAGVTAVGIGSAVAAVPENVTTAMGDGLTDVKTVAAAGLIIVIALAVFRYMKRGA